MEAVYEFANCAVHVAIFSHLPEFNEIRSLPSCRAKQSGKPSVAPNTRHGNSGINHSLAGVVGRSGCFHRYPNSCAHVETLVAPLVDFPLLMHVEVSAG